MFLTTVKLLSLKLQTKYPGFWVHVKAPPFTLLIATVHPSPMDGLAQRALHLPKASTDWDLRLHFFCGFCYCFSNLQQYFIASALWTTNYFYNMDYPISSLKKQLR